MEEHRLRKLLDQERNSPELAEWMLSTSRAVAGQRNTSYRTEHAYVGWIERCIRFNGVRRPSDLALARS